MERRLILASSSRWRQQLLGRLGLPFLAQAPDIDESPLHGESVPAMVERLSRAKAQALARQYPDALIIGSDQAAELNGLPIGKPGSHDRAVEQLVAQSGRCVAFHTGLCLLDASSGQSDYRLETTRVHFRPLSQKQIEAYLKAERPYDCAGSFRSEALGIALIRELESRDPTALVGLPLMAMCELLAEAGVDVLNGPARAQ